MTIRRTVAAAAALALFVEAVGIVVVTWILGRIVRGQAMSLDGLDPDVMVTATWALGGVFGVYLAVCGTVLLSAAVRDRGPGRRARILPISCAVVQGVLGALAVGLVGWSAFGVLMAVLGLVLLALISYGDQGPEASVEPTGEPVTV
jgi:hypothetical protein